MTYSPSNLNGTVPSSFLEKQYNLAGQKWDIIITRVIAQLDAYYAFCPEAQTLKEALTSLPQPRTQASLEQLKALKVHITSFRNLNLSNEEKNAQKNSLVCLLNTALTVHFPDNEEQEDEKGNKAYLTFIFNKQDKKYEKTVIPKEKQHSIIPTSQRLLYFVGFIIHQARFQPRPQPWQDVIRAVHHRKLRDPEWKIQTPIKLAQSQNITAEKDLWLVDETSKEIQDGSPCLSLERINFYYGMINRAASQAQILSWDEHLEKNKDLQSFINILFEYNKIVEQKSYYTDIPEDSNINNKIKDLTEQLKGHALASQYLENDSIDTELPKRVEEILTNLTSPILYEEILTFERLSYEEALNISPKDYIAPQLLPKKSPDPNRMDRLDYNIFTASDDPANTLHFNEFLAHLELDNDRFLEAAIENGTLGDIVKYLFSSNILRHINENKEVLRCKSFIDSPGALKRYVENLPEVAERAKKPSTTSLDEFITAYNESQNAEDNGKLAILNPEAKATLRPLERHIKTFAKTLRENSLAYDVICKEGGCDNLLEALNQYADLPQFLRPDKKQGLKYPALLELASTYNFNAKNDLILKAVKHSDLPIEIALKLNAETRLALNKYHDDLKTILTQVYDDAADRGKTKCEEYVLQHLKYLLNNEASGEDIAIVIENAVTQLDNDLLIGLMQVKTLSVEEALNLPSDLKTRFFKASMKRTSYHSENLQYIAKNGYTTLANIASELPQIEAERERLDALKEGTLEQNKQYLAERQGYFELLIGLIERINTNLSEHFQKSMDAILNSNVSFLGAIQLYSHERTKVIKDCKEAAKQCQDICATFPTPGKNTLLEKAQITTLSELLDKIKKDHEKEYLVHPMKLYPYARRIMSYLEDKRVIAYLSDDFLSIADIARLTPEAIDKFDEYYKNIFKIELRENSKSEYPNYKKYLQHIFKHNIERYEEITESNVQTIIQECNRTWIYLADPLIRQIINNQKVPHTEYFEALHEQGFSPEKLSMLPKDLDFLKNRFASIKRHEKFKSKLKEQNYAEFLSAVFKEDPQNQGRPFSFIRLIDCCKRYLDNLRSPLVDLFYRRGVSPIAVLASSDKERKIFQTKYEALTGVCNIPADQIYQLIDDLDSDSSEVNAAGNHPESLDAIWEFIGAPNTSLAEKTEAMTTAYANLTNPTVRALLSREYSRKSLIIAMQFKEAKLLGNINKIIKNLAKDSHRPFLRSLNQYIEKMWDIKTPEESENLLITQLTQLTQLPILMALLSGQPYRVEAILNNLAQNDIVTINTTLNKINGISNLERVQNWARDCRCTPDQLIAQSFINSEQPLNHLWRFLDSLASTVENRKKRSKISSLCRAGIDIPELLSVPQEIEYLYSEKSRYQKKEYKKEDIKNSLTRKIGSAIGEAKLESFNYSKQENEIPTESQTPIPRDDSGYHTHTTGQHTTDKESHPGSYNTYQSSRDYRFHSRKRGPISREQAARPDTADPKRSSGLFRRMFGRS